MDQISARAAEAFKASTFVTGTASPNFIELRVTGDERKIWSPQLSAELSEHDGETTIQARFSPDPGVWIAYTYSYGALGTTALIALAWGVSQLMLSQHPTGFYVAIGATVLAALTFGASFVGQGLGSEQMYRLRATLVEVSEGEDAEEEAPRAE